MVVIRLVGVVKNEMRLMSYPPSSGWIDLVTWHEVNNPYGMKQDLAKVQVTFP